jgi:large subunit ribosomal protein L9
MKIILQREVEKLGTPGEVVDVADGYARNYLLPRGLAVQASRGAIKHAERLKLAYQERERKAIGVAEAFAAELANTSISLTWRAGEDGKLFGSITAQNLAEELSKAVGREVDRRRIHLDEPIRSIGTHEVRIHLHPQVNARVTVEVVPQ